MTHSVIAFLFIQLAAAFWQDTGKLKSPRPEAVVLTIRLENETITPVTARFVRRAIEDAAKQQAQCLVMFLDTPGGLIEPTRDIVKDILRSSVPIVVYVAPTGARAASAGVFITLASHIAATPNIAFLLLTLGFYGILFEMYTPPAGVLLGPSELFLSFWTVPCSPKYWSPENEHSEQAWTDHHHLSFNVDHTRRRYWSGARGVPHRCGIFEDDGKRRAVGPVRVCGSRS